MTTSRISNTPVLIVGAGPTGLMAASQLQRFGIDFCIIDKRDGISKLSKAMNVSSNTLEIYDQLGVVNEVVYKGFSTDKLNIYIDGKKVTDIEFEKEKLLQPYFDFFFSLEQNEHEDILYNYLKNHGKKVYWKTELKGFHDNGKEVLATLVHADGKQEVITAKYVIGADGSNSNCRQNLNIPFKGEKLVNLFYVANTEVEWTLNRNEIYIFITKDSYSIFYPLPGRNRYRVIGTLPQQFPNQPNASFKEVKPFLEKQIKIPVKFSACDWFSTYQIHSRVAESFNIGNIFLAGDAAHTHSPFSGQGMNAGLQDAYNLCWKLAMVLQGKADKKLLNTYEEERKLNAELLLKSVDKLFTVENYNRPFMWFMSSRGTSGFEEKIPNPGLTRRVVKHSFLQTISHYKNCALSEGKVSQLQAGIKIPFFKIYDSLVNASFPVYDYLRQPKFSMISFNQDTLSNEKIKWIAAITEFNFIEVPVNKENIKSIEKTGFPDKFFAIVRPDNYIGYIDNAINTENILNYLIKNVHMNKGEMMEEHSGPY